MSDDETNLEILLARATNPLNKEIDLTAVIVFHDVMVEEIEGPQTALSFLAHRIQSPQEKEAMMALLVLEECVKKSNPRLLNEVGKFRFLNELIKVVSPKYLGTRAPVKVKTKILELMFKWSVELKHESKINEAYQMLKKQGVVTEDPTHVLENYEPPELPPPRPANAIFDDEEKSKELQKLLQSKDPQDLVAANRLIKNMVKEADRRMELMARTVTELETVHTNAKVLSDMLDRAGQTSEEEKELMKELFESCERLRPKLFRLAGEMDEQDSGLDDILRANDELTAVITKYRSVMGMEEAPPQGIFQRPTGEVASLMDLCSPTLPPVASNRTTSSASLLDEQLLNLGLSDLPSGSDLASKSVVMSVNSSSSINTTTTSALSDLDSIFSNNSVEPLLAGGVKMGSGMLKPTNLVADRSTIPVEGSLNTSSLPESKSQLSGLAELDVLSQSLLRQSLPTNITKMDFPNTPQKVPMNQLQKPVPPSPQPVRSEIDLYTSSSNSSPSRGNDQFSLTDIFVPLETIQPGTLTPLTLHEKEGLTVVVHFGRDSPRLDITVMVISTMSKNLSSPVKNVKFQAAVPKSMKIKLQPPSATDLPIHNPILPTAAITQVMLLANPSKDKVRLKYKISYTLNNEPHTDMGEVENLLAASR